MSNPFYNPYMKGPDFGSGIGDTAQNAMMAMMIRKYLMGGPQTQEVGQTPLGRDNPMGGVMGQAPQELQGGQFPGGQQGQMNPQMMAQLQALMEYLRQSGMGR